MSIVMRMTARTATVIVYACRGYTNTTRVSSHLQYFLVGGHLFESHKAVEDYQLHIVVAVLHYQVDVALAGRLGACVRVCVCVHNLGGCVYVWVLV